jgi:cobalt transporter subunit CbtB
MTVKGLKMNINVKAKTVNLTDTRTSALASIIVTATLGAALLFMAGFAQSATLHDTAHDSRHAIGFPCH